MIGMAEDAYQLKNLDDIMDYDPEIQLSKKPVYNSEQGVIYKGGKIYTADYSEEETDIIVRDIEGVIVDILSSETTDKDLSDKTIRNNNYKNWSYTGEK